MHYLTIAAFAAFGTTLATPVSSASHILSTRADSVDSAPAECDFTNVDSFDNSDGGNNWCYAEVRGYYAEGNIGCHDQSEGTGWKPPYYTQPKHPYCTCHSIDADAQGKHPVSVGIWFKGSQNPQEIEINTSNKQTDDGRCYSYQRSDGSVQSNVAVPWYSKGGVQFSCLWLNHTNVPEQITGFSTKKYVGNPQCPYN